MAEPQWEEYVEITSISGQTITLDHDKYEYRFSGFGASSTASTNELQFSGFPNIGFNMRDGLITIPSSTYPSGDYTASLRYASSNFRPGARIERLSKWAPPAMYPKVNGVVRETEFAWVKIDGTLREVDKVWIKVNGVLREA